MTDRDKRILSTASGATSSRRTFVKTGLAGVPIALAGCLGEGDDDDGDEPELGEIDEEPGDVDLSDAVHGGELEWGGSVPVQGLDPHMEDAAASHQVLENITQGLVRVNWEYDLDPVLAEDWESSDDNLELTFFIREGVTFHDGTELTSEDVIASFDRVQEFDGLGAQYLEPVATIDNPDDYTVEFELDEPFAPLLSRMATSYLHILPAHQAEQDSIDEPIGTGPFKFESRELDTEFVMERYDDYWEDDLPYLDRVMKQEISSGDNRLDTFHAGEVEFINDVPPRHIEELSNDPDVDLIQRFPQSLTYVGLNCTEPPFDDPDARRALDYAIDREEVLEAALYGQGQVASSPAVPDSDWEHPDIQPLEQDLDLAQEYLEAAGYPDGFEASFQIPEDYEDQVQAAQIIQNSASQVGIDLDIQQITWSNWLSDVYEEQNFEATTSSYLALWYPDAGFHNFLHPEGSLFFTGWEDEEYNDVVEEARTLYDVEDRAPLYHEAAELLREKSPGHLFLYWMPTLMARTHNYKGEVASPDGSAFRFEDTWLEE
ncbi:ABC transporter substrate-binding protein [Natrarchaeobaculum sulfurireducens]|uniref:ABC-type dipeptide/oligopeptide/nickel transport system, periplasmic component n=1 Tax=Natrarchaeobaculum sulfurireducens TaxID=2044521 RepID=A0A346PK96_9EURY|nr:ABC transporter substrate-binding protein [Natrarchaeobaculum sulfurireducens]AXR79941.1 ABC-type dipeptide/oligopeptide/nickel transport system, periplasmic component [Natrarchaeobaculum sulfurireducens]